MSDEQDDRITCLRAENERLKADNVLLMDMLQDVKRHMVAVDDYRRNPNPATKIKVMVIELLMASKYDLLPQVQPARCSEPGATPA